MLFFFHQRFFYHPFSHQGLVLSLLLSFGFYFFIKQRPPIAKEEYHGSFLITAFKHHPYYFVLHDDKFKGLCSVALYNFVFIDMFIVIYVITGYDIYNKKNSDYNKKNSMFFLFMFFFLTVLSLSPLSLQ